MTSPLLFVHFHALKELLVQRRLFNFFRFYKAILDFQNWAMRRERLAGRLCPLDQSWGLEPRIKFNCWIFMKHVLFYSRQNFQQLICWSPWEMRSFWGPSGTCKVIIFLCNEWLAVLNFLAFVVIILIKGLLFMKLENKKYF